MKFYGILCKSEDSTIFEKQVFTVPSVAIDYLKAKLEIEKSSIMEKWAVLSYINGGRKYFKVADLMDESYNIISEYYLFEIDETI